MVLNDDIEVESDFLSILVQKGISIPENLHVITGKIYCNHDRTLVWYAGGDLSLFMGSESTGAISRRTGRNITLIARSNTPAAA